jgi:hypothetical protein
MPSCHRKKRESTVFFNRGDDGAMKLLLDEILVLDLLATWAM